MKKLFFTTIGVLIFSSAFTIRVLTEVTATYSNDDCVYCWYKRVHLFYHDDGAFIGVGFSESGDCCPKSGIDINPNNTLYKNEIAELKSFVLTQTFANNQIEAVNKFNSDNRIGLNESDTSSTENARKNIITPFFPPHGVGPMVIVDSENGIPIPKRASVPLPE